MKQVAIGFLAFFIAMSAVAGYAEKPDPVNQPGEASASDGMAAPIVIVDASPENGQILAIGKEIEIEDACSIMLTSITAHDTFLGFSSGGNNKFLVLDVNIQNLTTDAADLEESMAVTLMYRGKYPLNPLVCPSMEALLVGKWRSADESYKIELQITNYTPLDEGTAQVDVMGLDVRSTPYTTKDSKGKVDIQHLYLDCGMSLGSYSESGFRYTIDVENKTLLSSKYSDMVREYPPLTLGALESVKLHLLFSVSDMLLQSNDTSILLLRFCGKEAALQLPSFNLASYESPPAE